MKTFAKQVIDYASWKDALCSAYSKTGKTDKWKRGRSAESLAYDFVGPNPTGEYSIKKMISAFLETDEIEFEYSHIEHPSVFDDYPRPRMQDLAIWGRVLGKRFFVGIEAKVDEEFGSNSVYQQEEYVKSLIKSNTPTEADKRLAELKRDFLTGTSEDDLKKLRYQLLYYLAGSIREPNTDITFMPVIVYESRGKKFKVYSESKGRNNKTAYLDFMRIMGFRRREDLENDEMIFAFENTDSWGKNVYSCYIVK